MKVKVLKVRKISSSFPKVAVLYRNDCDEDEHFPYKNLRHTIGCCIERRYGENYSIENIKRRIIEEQAVRVPFIENVYNYRIILN